MLKVRSLILNFFGMVLRVVLELPLDACHKGPGIAMVLSKKELEFFLLYGKIRAFFKTMTTFVLGPVETNAFAEEKNSK